MITKPKGRQVHLLRYKEQVEDNLNIYFETIGEHCFSQCITKDSTSDESRQDAKQFFYEHTDVSAYGVLVLVTYALEFKLFYESLSCVKSHEESNQYDICKKLIDINNIFSIDPATGEPPILAVAKQWAFDLHSRHNDFFEETLRLNFKKLKDRHMKKCAKQVRVIPAGGFRNGLPKEYILRSKTKLENSSVPISTVIAIRPFEVDWIWDVQGSIAIHTSGRPTVAGPLPTKATDLVQLLSEQIVDPARTSAILQWRGFDNISKQMSLTCGKYKFCCYNKRVLDILRMLEVQTYMVKSEQWLLGLGLASMSDYELMAHAKRLNPNVECTFDNAEALLLLNYFESFVLPSQPPVLEPVLVHPTDAEAAED